jgi:hypothetical protein
MAENIGEDVVDNVCEEVAGFSEDQARSEMATISEKQPALLAYVMASTEDLSEDAHELGIYMFVIIHRTFQKQFGKRLQNAGLARVEEIRDANEKKLEELVGKDDEVLETAVRLSQTQPALFGYVSECLIEPDEDETELPEDEQGILFLVMKTVIEVLDSSVRGF